MSPSIGISLYPRMGRASMSSYATPAYAMYKKKSARPYCFFQEDRLLAKDPAQTVFTNAPQIGTALETMVVVPFSFSIYARSKPSKQDRGLPP